MANLIVDFRLVSRAEFYISQHNIKRYYTTNPSKLKITSG